MATSLDHAKQLLAQLHYDRDTYLLKIDEYARGIQDDPYMPNNADQEYKLLAQRSKTNVMGLIVGSSAQAMYVDQFRRGRESGDGKANLDARTASVQPEWDHWQKSRLDARQAAIYRGALTFGHSFTITEAVKDKGVLTKGLSALKTTAPYEDPANDDAPYVALTVTRFYEPPKGEIKPEVLGKARMWDGTYEYEITMKTLADSDSVVVKRLKRHGADECPVTRFAIAIDLEGRTVGVVEPMIPLQDRINQTVFDLLVVQSFASFKVRTISGMAPPVQMMPVDEAGNEVLYPDQNADQIFEYVPRLGPNGMPIPQNINLNARRVFWAQDPDTKFGTLDETPLDGFIEAIGMAFQHMAALSQTPPHHLLGQIANLSAEALDAAETALIRKVEEFQSLFGESWERVFRLAAQIGDFEGADDYAGEVIWRDVGNRSMGQIGDALGKLAESLGIPKRGLWARVPNVTANELAHWEELLEQEAPEIGLSNSVNNAGSTRPTFRTPNRTVQTPTSPTPEVGAA